MSIDRNSESELGGVPKPDPSQELARRKESGDIANDGDVGIPELVNYQEWSIPLTRSEVGNHAVVIDPQDFDYLVYVDIVTKDGEFIRIDLENVDQSKPLILFPEDLGELNK